MIMFPRIPITRFVIQDFMLGNYDNNASTIKSPTFSKMYMYIYSCEFVKSDINFFPN